MSYAIFSTDPGRFDVWLFEVRGRNVVTGDLQVLYFSSSRYGTGSGDTLANQRYDAVISRPFERSGDMGMVHGPIAGLMPSRNGGSISLASKFGDLDLGTLTQLGGYSIRRFTFGNRQAIVRHGGYSPKLGRWLAYSEFKIFLNGYCDGNPLIEPDLVTFRLATKDRSFEYPVQERKFWGMGYGLHFDGTSGMVSAANAATGPLNFTTGDFTIEFPILVDSAPAAERKILSRGADSASGWSVFLSTALKVGLRTNQAAASQDSRSTALTAGRKAWCSVRRDGAVGEILIDGLLAMDVSGVHINPLTTAQDLYFMRTNSGGLFVNGLSDELRVWNVARTDEQINATKHRPLDPDTEIDATLVLYWPLTEGTGTTATDLSATAANGLISAGATWVHSGTGHDELSGQALPDVWGPVKGFPPVLLDEPRRIYQISSEPIQGFDRVDVGGSANMILYTGYANFLPFIVGSTPNGKYDTCICANGTFLRLGSNLTKPLTVEVRGNKPAGVYLENVADQVRYIVCNRGQNRLTDPTDLDTASFATLETDNSAAVGHGWQGSETIGEVINYALASIGAVGFFQRATGLFRVERFEGAAGETATVTITDENVALGTLRCMDRSTAVGGVVLFYQRNYAVMDSGDLLPGVAGTDRGRFCKNEWRSVPYDDASIRFLHKDAQTLELESGIDLRSAAQVEVNRLGVLYNSLDQAFRFLCRGKGVDLDRMDAVYFHYQDFARNGAKQSRFGTHSAAKFLVLETSDDIKAGGTWLTLWREEVV